jgi:type VI protein secretion system component Hcp
MELADPAVWGETTDEQYGMQGRALGAFEISSFDFSATSIKEDDNDTGGKAPAANKGGTAQSAASSATSQTVVKEFTIKKHIDKASPDLLMACCRAGLDNLSPKPKPIDWAIVSVRESGDTVTDSSGKVKANPWLIIEFQKVWVKSFKWSLSPGGDSESASGEEEVTFTFESILIKYCRQDRTGAHARVKIKGFNRSHPELDVVEIDPTELQQD